MKHVPAILVLAALWVGAPQDRSFAAPAGEKPRWDLRQLGRPPAMFPATNATADGVRSLFFEGLPYRGQPTRVFAFYSAPPGADPKHKVPAMVLVHGGGGTAFAEWVRLWNGRGYAAIAMDLCGCVPVGSYGKWTRHSQGGPPGWGGFDQIDEPLTDQWTCHAVADVLLAHSLLRSFPEIDRDRIGVTGISWGGYLTSIVAGVDPRFRCAVPVYGCGFLGDNSVWLGEFKRLGPEKSSRWLRWWDPSTYLPAARHPILWINGSNDFAYPMDSWRQSYLAARGPRTLCLKVRMPHGHGGAGENPGEIHAFIDTHLKKGMPLPQVVKQGRDTTGLWATWKSRTPVVKAELNYTRDAGEWQKRQWETVPADIDLKKRRASAGLPAGVTVAYLNLVDNRGLIVSAEHVEITHNSVASAPGSH